MLWGWAWLSWELAVSEMIGMNKSELALRWFKIISLTIAGAGRLAGDEDRGRRGPARVRTDARRRRPRLTSGRREQTVATGGRDTLRGFALPSKGFAPENTRVQGDHEFHLFHLVQMLYLSLERL